MLKYMRNKLVSVVRKDEGALLVHGVLDDDIYGLQMDVTISTREMKIVAIEGKWNRWTTPECPRAIAPLQEAVGFRINEKDLPQKINKIIGKKACRHHANLLNECCQTAHEAITLMRWEDEKKKSPELDFDDFMEADQKVSPNQSGASPVVPTEESPREAKARHHIPKRDNQEGLIIDMHTHTKPASPCSSVSVDDLVAEAKRIGLDGICLTDHNFLWNARRVDQLRERHEFLVLGGNEITTNQGDIIVFGLEKEINGVIKLEELRDEVDQAKGFMIAAHPFRGFLIFGADQLGLTPEKAMERPFLKLVDAIEVLNSKVTEKENQFALKVSAGLGLPGIGGSDAHELEEVGIYGTQFQGAIKDEKDLISALKEGNYSPVEFRRQGARERERYG